MFISMDRIRDQNLLVGNGVWDLEVKLDGSLLVVKSGFLPQVVKEVLYLCVQLNAHLLFY